LKLLRWDKLIAFVLLGLLSVSSFASALHVAAQTPQAALQSTPTGIVHSIPITITNSQSSPTPIPFQQELVINSATNSNYEASNLQNIEFFDSTGQVIPSWLESGNSNTATNTVYWLKLANGIPAGSSITIYMGFDSLSTNLFDGQTIGEAPGLSTAYGQYDNGAQLFNFYDNFAGTALNSEWTSYVNGGGISVDNGLNIQGSPGTFCGYGEVTEIDTDTPGAQFTKASVMDISFQAGHTTDFRFGFRSGDLCDVQDGNSGNGDAVNYGVGPGVGGTQIQIAATTSNPSTESTYQILSTPADTSPQTFTVAATDSIAQFYQNYTATSPSAIAINTPSYAATTGIGIEENYVTTNVHVTWVRLRAYPPNGVMPSVEVNGQSQTTTSSTSTTSITGVPTIGNGGTGGTSLSLAPGGQIYIFALSDGGVHPTSTFQYGQYTDVIDEGGQIADSVALTTNNFDSYTTQDVAYTMVGASVSGYSNFTAFEDQNTSLNADSASVSFQVPSQNALTVLIALASSQSFIEIHGFPGLAEAAASVNESGSDPAVIAYSHLSPGSYKVTEDTQPSGGTTPSAVADMLEVLIFFPSSSSSSSITTNQSMSDVTFTESGLPSGTNWSVVVNGETISSSSSTSMLNVASGSYSYSVNTVPSYANFPQQGVIEVNNPDAENVSVYFLPMSSVLTIPKISILNVSSIEFWAGPLQWTVSSSDSANNTLEIEYESSSAPLHANNLTIGSMSLNSSSILQSASGSEQVTFPTQESSSAGLYVSDVGGSLRLTFDPSTNSLIITQPAFGPIWINWPQTYSALLNDAQQVLSAFPNNPSGDEAIDTVHGIAECVADVLLCVAPVGVIHQVECIMNPSFCQPSPALASQSSSSPLAPYFLVAVMSPANILVTSPDDQSTGMLPNGTEINDISGSWFSGTNTEPELVLIPSGSANSYNVMLTGTATGTVHYLVASFAGDSPTVKNTTLQVTPGQVINTSFNLAGTTINLNSSSVSGSTSTSTTSSSSVKTTGGLFSLNDGIYLGIAVVLVVVVLILLMVQRNRKKPS
jgi:hypothetical protein